MEENLVTLTIDGVEVKTKKGTTILEAAKQAGIDIPTLCFLKDIKDYRYLLQSKAAFTNKWEENFLTLYIKSSIFLVHPANVSLTDPVNKIPLSSAI